MKKLLFILSLGFCLTTLHAQDADIPCKIQKSDIFKDEYRNSQLVCVNGDANGGVVMVRSYLGSFSTGYYFEHYDSSMKLVNEFHYELKAGVILGTLVNDNKVHMVEFTYDKIAKAYMCIVNTADINDFKFTPKELFRLEREEVKMGVLFNGNNFDNDYLARMLVGSGGGAFAISIDINDRDEKKEMRKIYVYDAGLNLKIENFFKRDIKDRRFKFKNIEVSENGEVAYLLGLAETPESQQKKEGGKYQYELSRITNSSIKTQVFDTGDHYTQSLVTVLKKDRIACVGFYSDRNDKRFKGLCYFDMDPETLEVKTTAFNPFTEQFMIDKYGKNKEKELKFIAFKNVYLAPNNDIIINAEENYVTSVRVGGMNNMGATYYNVFHYDDIISARLSNEGSLVWARNINKRQKTDDVASYISYSSINKNDNTYFFINTGDKVTKLSNDRIQFGQKSVNRSNLNVIKMDGTGNFEFKQLLDDKENEVPFMVANGAAAGEGNIYFLGRRGKKKQILKLSL